MAISDSIRQQVRAEANYRCEYCKTSSRLIGMGVTGLARQPKPKTANRLCQGGFGEDKDVQFRAESEID